MVKRKSEEMSVKPRTKRAKRFLEKREPKLVGLSLTCECFKQATSISQLDAVLAVFKQSLLAGAYV